MSNMPRYRSDDGRNLIDEIGFLIERIKNLESGGAGAPASGVFNVRNFGAVGNDIHDDTFAIQQAINNANQGDVVFFPPGKYRLTVPITMSLGVTLRGSGWAPHFAPRTNMTDSYLSPATGGAFVGSALIIVNPAPVNGPYLNSAFGGGPRIEGLALNGKSAINSTSGAIDAVRVTNGVKDITIRDVTSWEFTGHGFDMDRAAGIKLNNVVATTCDGHGFRMWDSTGGSAGAVDVDMTECYAQGNGGDGIVIVNPNAVMLTGCRSEFNTNYGYNISGVCFNLVMHGCDTDRSGKDGYLFSINSGNTVTVNGCLSKRDGRNGNVAGGGYAGFRVAPVSGTGPGVILNGCHANVGMDDDSTGIRSPEYGIRTDSGANRVSIAGGYYLGTVAAIQDNASVVSRAAGVNIGTVNPSTGVITMSTSDRVIILGNAGAGREYEYWTRGGGRRWSARVTSDAESGSNAGSNWALVRFSDTSTELGSPIAVNRATGEVTIASSLKHTGSTLGFYGTTPVAKPALTYSRTGEGTAAAQIRAALTALGLVTDSTTP